MNESKVQSDCIKYLDELIAEGTPLLYFRRDATGRNYKKGLPDLFFILNGVHVEVELKDVGGTPSSLQLVWERKFKQAHVPYVRPHSLAEFKDFIKKIAEN